MCEKLLQPKIYWSAGCTPLEVISNGLFINYTMIRMLLTAAFWCVLPNRIGLFLSPLKHAYSEVAVPSTGRVKTQKKQNKTKQKNKNKKIKTKANEQTNEKKNNQNKNNKNK